MYRFCVVTLVLCAGSLLALQFFVSFTPAYAQPSGGCADGTTDQDFGATPDGRRVHGCNGSVSFSDAGSVCATDWRVGDVVNDVGLRGILESQAGTALRWMHMNGDPGGGFQNVGDVIPGHSVCWGPEILCEKTSISSVWRPYRPAHGGVQSDWSYYNNDILVLANSGRVANGSPGWIDSQTGGAICIGPPPPPSVSITSPAAGSWHNASFTVGYDALGVGSCTLSTKDGGAAWTSRGTISCGAGQSTSIGVPAWCSIQGMNQCGVRITGTSGAKTAQDERFFSIVNTAPKVDAGGDQHTDFPGMLALDATVTDDGLPIPSTLTIAWTKVSGPGDVVFGSPSSADTSVSFTTSGAYVLRLSASDGELSAFDEITVTPPPYGLVPCGVDRNNPETDWNDMEDCQFRHFFLLTKILIDFALWKLVPLIIVILTVATGVIFYFQLGDVSVLATVRRIWHYVGIGVLILLFSWLFLNFLLGILGFDINIFGRWTEITV